MKRPPLQPISSRFVVLLQGVEMTRLYVIAEQKIQVVVYIDTYDFQSRARAQRWDGERWNDVATMRYPELQSVKAQISKYTPSDKAEQSLARDADALVSLAQDVLL